MTWEEIKLYTLQKMFAAEGNTIPSDDSTKDYIASMPAAANEALQMLSTIGKFLIKHIDIAHYPIKNLLPDSSFEAKTLESGTIEYASANVRSIYFECSGKCRYSITVGEKIIEEGILEKTFGFLPNKFLVENDDKIVKLSISSDYPFSVKNVALYSATFETVEEVPPFTEKSRYDLRELAEDFYMIDTRNIYIDDTEYHATSDYFQEGNTILVLDRGAIGNYRIYYKAYPQMITSATADDYELPVDREVATLIPLYMASQLYKDDDIGIATTYRNEFEVAFERLKNAPVTPKLEFFKSKGGWV